MTPHRRPDAVVAVFVLAALTGLALFVGATYRPAVHGPPVPAFVAAALVVIGMACAAGWAGARRVPAWAAGLLILAVALPGAFVHVRRWQQRQEPLRVAHTTPWGLTQAYEPTLRGAASLTPAPDGVHLYAPAGSVGFVEVRPLSPQDVPWDLPRVLLRPGNPSVGEAYAWRASVDLEGRYFILVETDRMLVQLTPAGVLVDTPGRPGLTVPRRESWSAPHEWVLRQQGGRTILALDGQEVHAEDGGGPFRYVRLGETRTDAEHGGTLRLHTIVRERFRA